jgi:hypothetical protein
MRVTLKSVNAELANLGRNVELAKGAGYFFFRGGEADNWIDRTVHVPTIGSLSMEQWTGEYSRLKAVNEGFMKPAAASSIKKAARPTVSSDAARPDRARAAKKPKEAQKAETREATRIQPCSLKPKLLAELEVAQKDMAGIDEQQLRAAREGRFSDLSALSEASNRERRKFDRALLAIRDHVIVHGC